LGPRHTSNAAPGSKAKRKGNYGEVGRQPGWEGKRAVGFFGKREKAGTTGDQPRVKQIRNAEFVNHKEGKEIHPQGQ